MIPTDVYKVTTPPTELPVSLIMFKKHLKIECLNVVDDEYLTLILEAVTEWAQDYTYLTFINTGYITYKTGFCNNFYFPISHNCYSAHECFELKQSPFQSLTSFKYLKDDTLVDVDSSIYYTTISYDYSAIVLKDGELWPTDADKRLQNIQIEFVAGYGADSDSVPKNIKMALMQHATAVYENRGDCDQASISSFVPNSSISIYDLVKIINVTGASICR